MNVALRNQLLSLKGQGLHFPDIVFDLASYAVIFDVLAPLALAIEQIHEVVTAFAPVF